MSERKSHKKHFRLEGNAEDFHVDFESVSIANEFGRMYFYSRLLHSLKPDSLGVWREESRLEAEIAGWPKKIKFSRQSGTLFKGQSESSLNLVEYEKELEEALNGISVGEKGENGNTIRRFEIRNGSSSKRYLFHSKARTIAALCVLYDLEPHPRNDLEINIPASLLPEQSWPVKHEQTGIVRLYGDPSKTADVLRNEGWSREGEVPGMRVFNKIVGGARQQMYQMLRKDQDISQRMMRTNISSRWRRALYESQNFTCRICGNRYEAEYLSPDHRIPVIFQPDELAQENFLEKLMTLCRYCNQQKREFCKRIPYNYDWETSPWAYPEKFSLQKTAEEIRRFAKIQNITPTEVLDLLKKGLD